MRSGARTALGVAGAAVVTATVAGFLGGVAWPLDLAANFRVQLLVAGVVLLVVVVLVARRRRAGARDARWLALALLLIASVVANAVAVAPLWTGRPDAPDGADRLTVAHLNLQRGGEDPERLAGFLADRSIDVFVVLDADPAWVEAANDGDLGGYELVDGPGERSSIFTRVEVGDVADPPDGRLPPAALEATVAADGGPVRLLALHAGAPYEPSAVRGRDRAIEAAGLWSEEQGTDRVLVVGDLNAARWTAPMRSVLADTELRDSERGFGFQPSYPAAPLPIGVPIDHSLHGAGLVPVHRSLGPGFGSRHRSLVVEYALVG